MKIPANLQRAARMLKPYRGRLGLAFLGMVLTASTEPMLPGVLKVLLDRGFVSEPTIALWMVPAALIAIFIVRGMSTFTTSYMMTWVSSRMLNELRAQMFQRVLGVPVSFYAGTSVGKVINSLMFETQQVIDMVRNVLTSLIRDTLTVLVLLLFLLWQNWQLTIVALILLPLTTLVVRLTGKRVRRLTREYLEVNAELTQVVEETTRAQHVIKIFGGQEYEMRHFVERSAYLRRFAMRMASTQAATVPVTQTMAATAVAVVIVIALIQASQGSQTVGGFIAFITAMLMLLTPLKRIAEVSGPLQRGLAAAESVYGLIDTVEERSGGMILPGRVRGQLDFVDVGFTYPGEQEPALCGINLSIRPGETVAFVGMSGGGKSTLVSLVPEFHPLSSGEIRLDQQPISTIALASLREQIAMVSQSVVLFDDSVTANVAYGDTEPDLERVRAAVRAAHLEDVVAALPQGLDTRIGNNGSRLSGGQRQRLAIARAIYKDAPILILDEATSALDSESERMVQNALDTLMQGRTTLVIAHRLSTIERADRIAVLEQGRIVEIGSHQQLLERNGVYANLYHLQFEKDAA